ncbi:hypothetical protein MKY91_20250 [Alkalicoccobacillus gibsonii]|uniref:Type II secretion system protein GspF domain-containing protein n=1 Tax=Alkalicoccobacillus gibsonii TaxID=79881 RepID=A0ABU9VNM5_9BACI
MYIALEAVIKIIGYSAALYGLWMLVGSHMTKNTIISTVKYSLWKMNKQKRTNKTKIKTKDFYDDPPIIEHLDMLIRSVGNKEYMTVFNFNLLTLILFIATTGTLYGLLNELLLSVSIGFFVAITPYVLLRVKLITIRLATSEAFSSNFHSVIQSYSSNDKDIYYTIKSLTETISDKALRNKFKLLLSAMQTSRSDIDFNKNTRIFAYSINSTFAMRFSKLVRKSYIERTDVSQSLIDLNQDIQIRRRDMEKEKTNNAEAIILNVIPAVILPIAIFAATRLTMGKDFWFYFTQKESLYLFVITIMLVVISLFIAYVASKKRADI